MSVIKKIETVQEVTVVALAGNLDLSVQKKLQAELSQIFKENELDTILDFSEVVFIDSACLGVLVSLVKELRQKKGDIKLVKLTDDVKSIFQITRLDKIFHIYDVMQEAVESYYL